jgi:hypothetical protein
MAEMADPSVLAGAAPLQATGGGGADWLLTKI